MTGKWKDTNKNFLKDKLKWYVQNDKLTYERNISHTMDGDLDIDERLIETEFKEYQKYVMEVQVPLDRLTYENPTNDLTNYTRYRFVCYFKPDDDTKVFDPKDWYRYDFTFSEDNEYYLRKFDKYEKMYNLQNLNLIEFRNKWDNELALIGNFFYWRNWDYDPVYVSVKPIFGINPWDAFETELVTHYYDHTTWEDKYMMYKSFLQGVKLSEHQIHKETKTGKFDGLGAIRDGTFKAKASKDIYPDKELKDFKGTSNAWTKEQEDWDKYEDTLDDSFCNEAYGEEEWEDYMSTDNYYVDYFGNCISHHTTKEEFDKIFNN